MLPNCSSRQPHCAWYSNFSTAQDSGCAVFEARCQDLGHRHQRLSYSFLKEVLFAAFWGGTSVTLFNQGTFLLFVLSKAGTGCVAEYVQRFARPEENGVKASNKEESDNEQMPESEDGFLTDSEDEETGKREIYTQ